LDLYESYISAAQQGASNLYAVTPHIAPKPRSPRMLDLLFVAIGLSFLAGAMLYAVVCDRL
jgi:hypothetical protein